MKLIFTQNLYRNVNSSFTSDSQKAETRCPSPEVNKQYNGISLSGKKKSKKLARWRQLGWEYHRFYLWVREASLRTTIWFHLHNILEKTKLITMQSTSEFASFTGQEVQLLRNSPWVIELFYIPIVVVVTYIYTCVKLEWKEKDHHLLDDLIPNQNFKVGDLTPAPTLYPC